MENESVVNQTPKYSESDAPEAAVSAEVEPEELNEALEDAEGKEVSPEEDAEPRTQLDGEAARRELDKVRKEAAKYRTRLNAYKAEMEEKEKAAERAKLSEIERVKAEKEDLTKEFDALKQQLHQSNLKTKLVGRVVDPDVAILLLEKHGDEFLDADGEPDVDFFLQEYPYMAQVQAASQSGEAKPKVPAEAPRLPSARNERPPSIKREDLVELARTGKLDASLPDILIALKEGRL